MSRILNLLHELRNKKGGSKISKKVWVLTSSERLGSDSNAVHHRITFKKNLSSTVTLSQKNITL
jgi:hypothetical protein